MNQNTAVLQNSFQQSTQQDALYAGDMLVTICDGCTIFQTLEDIVLDMNIED